MKNKKDYNDGYTFLNYDMLVKRTKKQLIEIHNDIAKSCYRRKTWEGRKGQLADRIVMISCCDKTWPVRVTLNQKTYFDLMSEKCTDENNCLDRRIERIRNEYSK
ncbi:MAG: hypothetical protein V3T09_08435 [bacterium]